MQHTLEEFDCVLRACNLYLSSEEVQQLFRDLDSDGNKCIDIREF
jgi:Ca2+-binding EF-hand superfamily protein